MREVLDQWNYVIAAYALCIGGTLALVAWSWFSMRRAERHRDKVRGK
jgi:hypothetical protein